VMRKENGQFELVDLHSPAALEVLNVT